MNVERPVTPRRQAAQRAAADNCNTRRRAYLHLQELEEIYVGGSQ